jgi:molecular chaperone GrpE
MTYGYSNRPPRRPHPGQAHLLSSEQLRQIQESFRQMEDALREWQIKTIEWETTARKARAEADEWKAKAVRLEEAALTAETRVAELENARLAADASMRELQDELGDLQESRPRLERLYNGQAEARVMAVLRALLPVLDNLELALLHAPPPGSALDGVVEGVQVTRKSFLKALADQEVYPLDLLGKPYDAHIAEAVGFLADDSLPPWTVTQVIQEGFTFKDSLLRPARVMVTPDQSDSSAQEQLIL